MLVDLLLICEVLLLLIELEFRVEFGVDVFNVVLLLLTDVLFVDVSTLACDVGLVVAG